MRLLAAPLNILRGKKAPVDLSVDGFDESKNDPLHEHRLTSGWLVKDSQASDAPGKARKTVGYVCALLALVAGFFSMLYLPVILVSPTRFCFLFSLALIAGLAAVTALKGRAYVTELFFSGPQRSYSITLFSSNVISAAVSWFEVSAILCLVLGLVQLVALSYVLFTRIPHGKQCLDSFYGGIARGCKSLASKAVFRRSN